MEASSCHNSLKPTIAYTEFGLPIAFVVELKWIELVSDRLNAAKHKLIGWMPNISLEIKLWDLKIRDINCKKIEPSVPEYLFTVRWLHICFCEMKSDYMMALRKFRPSCRRKQLEEWHTKLLENKVCWDLQDKLQLINLPIINITMISLKFSLIDSYIRCRLTNLAEIKLNKQIIRMENK